MSAPFIALPVLHGDAAPVGPLWTDWHVQPTVILGVVALVAGYLIAVRRLGRGPAGSPVGRGQIVAFLTGAAALLVALGPPLDDWADHYLLSAHMLQHLMLTLLVPPLLLLGTPASLLAPLLRWPAVARVGFWLTRPPVAYLIAGLTLVVWHVPVFYEAALRAEPLHALEHVLFLGSALLVWWPVLGSLPAWPRLSPPLQCLYLFLLTLPGGIIGAIITMAEPGLYAPYRDAPRISALGVATDQEIAGLLMWVGGFAFYLAIITVVFFRWAAAEEARDRPAAGHRQPSVAGS